MSIIPDRVRQNAPKNCSGLEIRKHTCLRVLRRMGTLRLRPIRIFEELRWSVPCNLLRKRVASEADGHKQVASSESRPSGCGSSKPGRRAHKHGISSAAVCKWKAKCGELEESDAKRLKALDDENAKLKKLLAEAMRDSAMLKDVALRKW